MAWHKISVKSHGCSFRFPRTLGVFTNALQPVRPTLRHAVAMLLRDQAHSPVSELQPRARPFGGQSILNVIDGRIRHGHRSVDFKQGWRLDDLHVAPEMAGVVAEIAE